MPGLKGLRAPSLENGAIACMVESGMRFLTSRFWLVYPGANAKDSGASGFEKL